MGSRTLILLIFIIVSCSKPEPKKANNTYTDIKGFFEAEVSRLSKSAVLIDKTVKRNDISETKTGISVNWANELSLFIESDINKPAWRDRYKIIENKNRIHYTALDDELRTRSIQIQKDLNGRLLHILIKNETQNNLYQSSEILSYFPDSFYTINKSQNVILLGSNTYTIKGTLK